MQFVIIWPDWLPFGLKNAKYASRGPSYTACQIYGPPLLNATHITAQVPAELAAGGVTSFEDPRFELSTGAPVQSLKASRSRRNLLRKRKGFVLAVVGTAGGPVCQRRVEKGRALPSLVEQKVGPLTPREGD